MKLQLQDPPRIFEIGRGDPIRMADCGRIALEPDEQVTFVTAAGGEYDVARKAWGFYATPSLNGRLLNFGLRGALARSYVGKYYVFLVERGHEDEFAAYLAREKNVLVRWLDNDEDLAAIAAAAGAGAAGAHAPSPVHCMCGADRFTTVYTYFAPPAGEVRFAHSAGTYRREIFRCSLCGHYVSIHEMDDQGLYGGAYVDSTYGGDEGMRRTYEKILALPPERSDNAGRVRRVVEFAAPHAPEPGARRSILDVGSGLGVFLRRMKDEGWECTALDPDPRAARHASETAGVHAVCADFMTSPPAALGRFHVVSFNKVLEHVRDPAAMLARAAPLLRPGGFVYLELPDGEAAVSEGFGREEFFIEHFHVFSLASVSLLAERAGFRALAVERLREPSTKFTLRAFLAPRAVPEGAPAP